jgi:hydrogenase maturation protease
LAGSKSAKAELLRSCGKEAANYSPRITVLGIGNLLLQDEGVGIHLVQRLADKVDSPNINLIDGGTTPDILSLVDNDIDKLIIVDAAVVGDKPGTIYRFDIADLDSGTPAPVSLHELGLVDSLKLMNLFGKRPKMVTVIGIEPKVIDYGLELSPELEEKMPRLVELVLDEIKETNTSMEVDR